MNNYKMMITYDGTKYLGWQRLQKNKEKTIQGKIELTISKLLKENIEIIGSGRTDRGVHALNQVANFKTNKELDSNFLSQLNQYLPEDIRVLSFIKVNDKFHSRYNAKRKTYMYRIDNSPVRDPFMRKYAYYIDERIDIIKMKEASKIFIGEHDFITFSKKSTKKSTVRNIEFINIVKRGDFIEIYITANGFLYNMARMIAGALIQIATNKKNIKEIKDLLESKSRGEHRFVVPPHGLFLLNVEY
ncbi:tRNA pseudouridine38-40 synthase [Hypnocyclicus thermotrophus]|uniref:tRNA pseudouridine synthase A n=1 Tax=Hypnocyclicus thermotrophus TaxID=1627895 RepID=A0AA46DX01_9FUSO|nr:tRNA pseudouridine(38-40) synthase TruA [Hypnocyclicus thermotrophus]TDT67416.1 tRNA pseudouridine38-40 synthase [Hypnocyclicus thermotrophus]